MTKKSKTTPLMEQYLSIKADYKDVLLLYRMGDFYETFYDDAKVLSKTLGIALTKRAHGKSADVPLAGFPYHALDTHLPKLLNAGLRVAICEQVEDPKLAKGVVKREVVEIASPGATLSDKLLDSRSNNFLVAVHFDGDVCGLAVADVSTGSLQVAEFPRQQLLEQLLRFTPKEILVAQKDHDRLQQLTANRLTAIFTRRDDWLFSRDYAYEVLITHFKTHSLKGFGCEEMDAAISAAGVLMHYLGENYKTRLEHFVQLQVINLSRYMVLDASTRRNLEIARSISGEGRAHTLLQVLDYTTTPMGARLFKQWLQQPLLDKDEINKRLDIVQELVENGDVRRQLIDLLKRVFDMERLLGKIVTGRANARDLLNLNQSLQLIAPIKQAIGQSGLPNLTVAFEPLTVLEELCAHISAAIVENPPLTIQEGGLIRSGYHPELDELRAIAGKGKDWLLEYQETERKRTGITTLKVNYNKVFGYYIEVTNTHKDKIPETYIRKQTLVNAERFITPELKEWEEKILGAEEKINALEYEIFQQLRREVSDYIEPIQRNSRLVAELDCHLGLAVAARENGYVRPVIDESDRLDIVEGRHPVVEKNMPIGEDFIANDAHLDTQNEQIWIITGPNMAGKSTFLRQVGLIVLMAQIGSFVPAREARIGIVDRIFTRVGASDNLALGESTFLVEMNETASILNAATSRSLILLDEIGRGTSTFDGLSIAWAVAEYLHNTPSLRAKTLFATHYHELTELALLYPRIKNYNVAVEEWEDQVVFLRKIVPGGTDNSYGIYVAQMAGLPPELIARAKEILANLEANELTPHSKKPKLAMRRKGRSVDVNQLSLFGDQQSQKVKKALDGVDINRMTPLQALQKLDELKKIVEKKEE
ncbi:MAG TPA: DNA mismatch repair protein MutS [Caldithrix abyssi]|uniref:DNA mismatch repair protein MutS n=1 Tax=Caldithrix abyssi TaxID=187145 RepID=A0A7V5UFI0_CALAY|nr:DNA mismatch repair protein MutS [Caldithrix abyssi]